MRFDAGWIKIHRSLDDHWVGSDGIAWAIFTRLITWANYKDKKALIDGTLQVIRRGQVVTSSSEIAAKLGFERKCVERRLKLLENDQMIVQQVSNRGRIITICNYDKYQDFENASVQLMSNQRDNSSPTHGQLMDNSSPHSKEGKNSKKEKRKELNTSTSTEVSVPKDTSAHLFISHYCEIYKIKYTTNPVIDGRASAIAKRVVKSIGLEKAKLYVERYLEMNEQWFITKSHDLATFEGNLNKIAVFQDTGRRITTNMAKQADVAQSNDAAFKVWEDRLRQKGVI